LAYERNPQEPAGVREGEILAGKYRVEKVLGVGGMGVVVAAKHVQLDEHVAIKFLLPEMQKNAEIVARFAREARAAVKIKSEHVARVFDVGQLDDGSPYMVMEFLDGGDLAAWLRQRGPMPLEQATEFVIQACVAIAEAHGLGIVHRDLKPANLYCIRRPDGQLSIKVLDFGISKLTDLARASEEPGGSVTRTSAVMGSPLYMSPEQVQNAKDVDARTDIWSLGVILFELVTGAVPFPGETFGEIAVKIAVRPALSIRAYRSDVPAALEAALARALDKDRDRRYRNVAEFALALLPFSSGRAKGYVERISDTIRSAGLSAGAVASPPSTQPQRTLYEQTAGGVTRTDLRDFSGSVVASRRRVGYAAALAGLLVVCGIAAVALHRGSPTNGSPPRVDSTAPAGANPAPTPPVQAAPPPSSVAAYESTASPAADTAESRVIPSSKGYSHAPSPSEHRVSPSPDKPKSAASTPPARTPAAMPSNPLDLPPLR
jgi:eukaryotic-like serine/threonine-protein kinase